MSKYTELITNYHRGKPLFVDHVDLSTRPLTDTSVAIKGLVSAFDIDEAVGVQLDALGEWIGRSRIVSQPISGVYFSFDTAGLGWDQGVWQGPYDPDTGYTSLSDETYRVVLKAKIAINNWDGSNDSLKSILHRALEGSGIRMAIVDNQDMSISIWVLGDPEAAMSRTDRLILDSTVNDGPFVMLPSGYATSLYNVNPIDMVDRELWWAIQNGYLTIKAAGVSVKEIVTTSDGFQFFGFDLENDYVAGFDEGSWERKL